MGKGNRNTNRNQEEKDGLVFSTNPGWTPFADAGVFAAALDSKAQVLYVSLSKKQRAGKPVTFVEGFQGPADELLSLGKLLKQRCGVGGSVKEGCVLIQGDHREKVILALEEKGYRVKRKGG
ncbi:MAG: translation initiation factor [Flavobacteriales bacterium]|jgi:translation initiation factor 1|nr:translation initiation factor [Flavobacteriales bacterium]MDG2209871.1 translation initiation factor [Flavobacteriales bacterium]